MIEYKVRVYGDGTKFWDRDGKLHREDGPAIESSTGTKCWYRDGKLHREDGPAAEDSDGRKYWYRNGVEYNPNDGCSGKIVEIDGEKYRLQSV